MICAEDHVKHENGYLILISMTTMITIINDNDNNEDDGTFLQTARENTGTDQKLHDRAAL